MKARYLIHFSYIGTNFRGFAKVISKKGYSYPDPFSIQGIMGLGLQNLNSLNFPEVVLSSRTDAGVHALNSAAHVDLERSGSKIYQPEVINKTLNKYFRRNELEIGVKNVVLVPNNFHARLNAISRTYLYRFAVPKFSDLKCVQPIEEWKRCAFFSSPNFDIDKFKEAAQLFVGLHDFTSFNKTTVEPYKHNRRTIFSVDVRPGKPLTTFNKEDYNYDFWDFEVTGRGFVHNQIRRTVAFLKAVAEGKLSKRDILMLLQIPSKKYWPAHIRTAPPEGLYLCNVEYNPQDLACVEETVNFRKKNELLTEDLDENYS